MGKGGSVSVKEGAVMPEDAPGNPGARRDAPAQQARMRKVREMQGKLHRWGGEDSSRRFGDLFNLVYDPEFLAEAWFRVAGNDGKRTPGIDKATVASIENGIGVGAFLEEIRGLLKSGEFRPVPVRQVMIPKKSGKLRKLGIPTVTDRVVQASLKLVLEPIFEADFQPFSYGFRPGRRQHDAIAEIHNLASEPINYCWVLEADIKACFDEIGHVPLMDRLRARIKDKRILALVKAFLKAGIMTPDGEEESYSGTPQGGILSPLLANIALSALDDHFAGQWQTMMKTPYQRRARRKRGLANRHMTRFADGFVVLVDRGRRPGAARRSRWRAVRAGAAAGTGEDPRGPHRRGLRLPQHHHPPHAETGNEQALRLHQACQEGHPGSQGQGFGENVQVNPAPGTGGAHREHQRHPDRVGELPPARSVQGRLQRCRPPCVEDGLGHSVP